MVATTHVMSPDTAQCPEGDSMAPCEDPCLSARQLSTVEPPPDPGEPSAFPPTTRHQASLLLLGASVSPSVSGVVRALSAKVAVVIAKHHSTEGTPPLSTFTEHLVGMQTPSQP